MTITSDEVLAEAVGCIEQWLPGYTYPEDGSGQIQHRVTQVGDGLYKFAPAGFADGETVVYRIRIGVELVQS